MGRKYHKHRATLFIKVLFRTVLKKLVNINYDAVGQPFRHN